MAKKISQIIMIWVMTFVVCGPMPAAEQTLANLTDVIVNPQESSYKILLRVSRPVKFKDFVLNKDKPKIVVDLYETQNAWLAKSLNVNTAPVSAVRSSQFRIKPQYISRVVIDLEIKTDYQITESTGTLEINLVRGNDAPVENKPKKIAVQPDQESLSTASGLISLNFEKAEVRDVLAALGLKKGINIIIDDDVKGEITLNLQNVSFEEALATITKIKNLAMDEIGKQVIRISSKEKAGLRTTFFLLKHGKAEEVATIVAGLLTDRGKILVDKRTNGLLITENTSNMDTIIDAIEKVDIKADVVEIKAEIVEVEAGALKELGINWSLNTPAPGTKSVNATSNLGNLNINIGTVLDMTQLQTTLSLLGSKRKSKLLSSPRITTLANQPANINMTDKVPYEKKTVSSSAAGQLVTETAIDFLDVGIKLEVTPNVNVDKQVTMKIKPEVSNYTPVNPGSSGSTLPPIVHTRQAETTVVIKDNQTIVIGGLIRENESNLTDSVPFLSSIPILGQLFQHRKNSNDKTELLIFITPHILE